jgi:PAS domain S-box-containing protein
MMTRDVPPPGPPLDIIPTLIWSAEADGSAAFFNQPWLDYVGLPIEAVQGWGWTAALHPDDRDRVADAWKDIVASARPAELEARLRRHDGVYRWFLFRARPVHEPDGTLRGWVGTNMDIDDLKRTEAALQQREQELRTLIEAIPAMISAADGTGRQNYANRRLLDYLGSTLEETADRGWLRVVHPDDREETAAAWEHAMATGEPFDVLHRMRRFDGVYRWYHARAEPLRNAAGEIVRWYALLSDVHDLRIAEEALRHSQAELAHVARVTTIGELSASIVHEVNQPLAAIVNNAAALLEMLPETDPQAGELREALRDILHDADRAGAVIARVRQLASKAALERAPVSLRDVVDDVVALTRHEAAVHRARIRIDVGDDVPPVLGDRIQLQQVVLNLVLNGFEAMEAVAAAARELSITVRRAPDATPATLLTVEDAGSGFGDRDPERCFEAFYSTKPRGMGMGLAISRSIVAAHGGRLWAEPRATGPGAVFLLHLPATA